MTASPQTLLVAYDLNASNAYDKLYYLFKLLKAQQLQHSLWSVPFSGTPQALLQMVKDHGDSDDDFLVIDPKAIYPDPRLFSWSRAVAALSRSGSR